MTDRVRRWGPAAGAGAGVLWLLIWLHQRQTHGATAENEQHLALGLTWMDAGKVLVVPLLLVGAGLVSLFTLHRHPGVLARGGFAVAMVGLALMVVGTALQFWTFPWGSYALDFGTQPAKGGGTVQAIGTLVLTAGLAVWSFDLVRSRLVPLWAAPVLVLGALTTFFLTPVVWVPGVAWLVLGWGLWRHQSGRPRDGRGAA